MGDTSCLGYVGGSEHFPQLGLLLSFGKVPMHELNSPVTDDHLHETAPLHTQTHARRRVLLMVVHPCVTGKAWEQDFGPLKLLAGLDPQLAASSLIERQIKLGKVLEKG